MPAVSKSLTGTVCCRRIHKTRSLLSRSSEEPQYLNLFIICGNLRDPNFVLLTCQNEVCLLDIEKGRSDLCGRRLESPLSWQNSPMMNRHWLSAFKHKWTKTQHFLWSFFSTTDLLRHSITTIKFNLKELPAAGRFRGLRNSRSRFRLRLCACIRSAVCANVSIDSIETVVSIFGSSSSSTNDSSNGMASTLI